MSEPQRHADEGFHEIQLSGKQLVFLFMATTVVAVVIFLCGVLVGRGARPSTTLGATSAALDPAAPAPPPDAGPPAPTGGAATPQSAAGGTEDLSYHRRLQGDGSGAASASSADDQLKARQADPPAPAEAPRGAAPAAAPPGPEGGWVVQIAALRDRAAADAIVRRLTTKGYPTFVLEPVPGAPAPGYRVRVGRYADRREAERVGRRLEREEQFRPFITR